MNEWERDRLEAEAGQLRRLARALGVMGDVPCEGGFRLALLSAPDLFTEEDEQGVLEVTAYMIADDCHDQIDWLKSMVVLLNRLLIEAGASSEEVVGAIEESAAYIQRMRDFPIRS